MRSPHIIWLAALAVLTNLSTPLLAAEKNDDSWYTLGLRLGFYGVDVLTDAERDVYATNYGSGGTFSADVAIQITSTLYLHAALGLDYRDFATLDYMGMVCDGDCAGPWSGENETELVYLEIPLLTQLRTSFLYWEVGPVVDILLSTQEDYFVPEKYRGERCYDDKRIGVGISAGIGHMFSFGLSVDARITYQLTDIVSDNKGCLVVKTEESETYVGGTYYNLYKAELGVGYWF